VRGGVETHMNRILLEILLLKAKDAKFSPDELKVSSTDYDSQLDRRLVSEMRKVLEGATVTAPKATLKPNLAVPIVGAPPKAAPTSGTTTTTTPTTTPTSPKP
jgi:hypothetical protein